MNIIGANVPIIMSLIVVSSLKIYKLQKSQKDHVHIIHPWFLTKTKTGWREGIEW